MSDQPTPAHSAARPTTDRAGFDEEFLGLRVPMPTRAGPLVVLAYTHFSVALDRRRRMAAATAVGIDGASLQDLPRAGIDWELDPRISADEQTGEEVYADNDLDRGHLVRRRDPVWGDTAEAALANTDSFTYPNAAPQAAQFNQSKELWGGLEDYLLDNAATYDRRLVVLTGPVLDADDPPYRGIAIPLRFWKVAGFLADERLASTAYVLDQTAQLPDLPASYAEAAAAGLPPPLGPYRTFQLPVADVAAITGLDLGPLPAADRYTPPAADGQLPTGWRELTGYADIPAHTRLG